VYRTVHKNGEVGTLTKQQRSKETERNSPGLKAVHVLFLFAEAAEERCFALAFMTDLDTMRPRTHSIVSNQHRVSQGKLAILPQALRASQGATLHQDSLLLLGLGRRQWRR